MTAPINDFVKKLSEDPAKLKQFLRNVMGPSRRTITGTEKALMLTLFKLIEPVSSSNNQRSFTDVYVHAGKTYDVHYFDDETVVEEILEDEES